jgi:hypothetical protein
MRQSLATLESLLARNGISPSHHPNNSAQPTRVSHAVDANGRNTPSQVGSTPSNDGLLTVESNTCSPAMEVGMYVGPTSAASPLLSFRVR